MHDDLIRIIPEKYLPKRTTMGFIQTHFYHTVGYDKTNDAATKECYNEQISSIKSGSYNEHKCYNERGEILSADLARQCP